MDDADLEREWASLRASWAEPDAHKRFLVLCESTGRLAFAGRRYREVREHEPERRAEAERAIDEILGRAVAQMKRAQMKTSEAAEPRHHKRRLEWVALGVSSALIAAALWQILRGP